MRTFLIALLQPDFLPPLVFPNDLHVEFLQALPIFDSEREYKSRLGVEGLLALWNEASLPFGKTDRAALPG